jgi:Leucyl-tRNA synthetase
MWEGLGHSESLTEVSWPGYDEDALVKDTVEIVIQINGKLKDKLNMDSGLGKEELEKAVMAEDSVKALTEGKNVVKVIAIPDKLVNIVVK